MKTRFITCLLITCSLSAFAQTKLVFNNNAKHQVYFTSDMQGLATGDSALAGALYSSSTTLSGGGTLVADLYMGSSAATLGLVASTTFSSTPGLWNSTDVVPQPIGAGTYYFQVQVHDLRDANEAASMEAEHYFGNSVIFSGTPLAAPLESYLTDFWPDSSSNADASRPGGIELQVVPEPSVGMLAVFALALGSLLRCQCKQQN
jgi:hypothetical protein